MKAKWRREISNKACILQHTQISKAVGALVFSTVLGVTVVVCKKNPKNKNNLIVYFSSNRWKYMLISLWLINTSVMRQI